MVAQNTEADLARKRASAEVSWALRQLTANLLRIVRGAGAPGEIIGQIDWLLGTIMAFQNVVGLAPFSEYPQMLDFVPHEEWRRHADRGQLALVRAEERIVRGLLQIAASRLVGQTTQERAGESEMYAELRDLKDAREEIEREAAAARAEAIPSRKRRPAKTKG